MSTPDSPRRTWPRSLLGALAVGVFVGVPTGFAVLILGQGFANGWFFGMPALLFIGTLIGLRYVRPLPTARSRERRHRAVLSALAAAGVLALDALVIGGVIKREGGCTWEYSDEIAATTTLDPGGLMQQDSTAPYADAVDNVDTFIKHSLVLRMAEPSFWSETAPTRQIAIDLSQPVPGSGAVSHAAPAAGREFKSFWYRDDNRMIRTVHAIPLGTTVPSPRTEVLLTLDGRKHYLTMGEWARGYCEGTSPIHGEGTSQAMISRAGQEDFRVDLPLGSVARLWDISSDPPQDKGLYSFHLRAHFVGKQ